MTTALKERPTASTATAIPPITKAVPTSKDLMETIAKAFERHGEKTFKAIPDLERTSPEVVAAMPTVGTILQVAVDTLNAANVPTQPTVGDVKKNLELTDDDVHELACMCNGDDVAGTDLAQRFRNVARRRR